MSEDSRGEPLPPLPARGTPVFLGVSPPFLVAASIFSVTRTLLRTFAVDLEPTSRTQFHLTSSFDGEALNELCKDSFVFLNTIRTVTWTYLLERPLSTPLGIVMMRPGY